jgi:hypothetical protein
MLAESVVIAMITYVSFIIVVYMQSKATKNGSKTACLRHIYGG